MLALAFWMLAAAVAGGLGLAWFWLTERPPGALGRAFARWGSIAHGSVGAAGTCLLLAVLWGGAPDVQNFGHLAGWFLAAALAGGAVIVVAQVRRRRPPGLVVILHATIGVAGLVLLVAYRSIQR